MGFDHTEPSGGRAATSPAARPARPTLEGTVWRSEQVILLERRPASTPFVANLDRWLEHMLSVYRLWNHDVPFQSGKEAIYAPHSETGHRTKPLRAWQHPNASL
jgi:hypothetical protein